MDLDLLRELSRPADTRVLVVVLDGLGGLGRSRGGATPLQAAATPSLDELARGGICGLHEPVGPGITPGSGPGHLALFGYDPLRYRVGRGVLSALGIDFELQPGDVAARGNFCTLDDEGRIEDRRAGRIASERGETLAERLHEQVELDDVEVFVRPVAEHRFLLVLRGDGLSAEVTDTDPQRAGVGPHDPEARTADAERTAELVQRFTRQAREILSDEDPANGVLLRGLSSLPDWPTLPDLTGMRLAASATYPMYRGVARLVGMQPLAIGGEQGFADRIEATCARWRDFDLHFVHAKHTDSVAEDGDYDAKVAELEAIDEALPQLLGVEADVVVLTGDHSTGARLAAHTWHPVPLLLAADTARPDGVEQFTEAACTRGGLGPRPPAHAVLPLALAHAGHLAKFGA